MSRGVCSFIFSKFKDPQPSSRHVLEEEVGIDLEEAWIIDTYNSLETSYLDRGTLYQIKEGMRVIYVLV